MRREETRVAADGVEAPVGIIWVALRMSLNVWSWNDGAHRLYERAGYATIAIGMTKVFD
jgi:hypothetical protein